MGRAKASTVIHVNKASVKVGGASSCLSLHFRLMKPRCFYKVLKVFLLCCQDYINVHLLCFLLLMCANTHHWGVLEIHSTYLYTNGTDKLFLLILLPILCLLLTTSMLREKISLPLFFNVSLLLWSLNKKL